MEHQPSLALNESNLRSQHITLGLTKKILEIDTPNLPERLDLAWQWRAGRKCDLDPIQAELFSMRLNTDARVNH